MIGRSAQRFRGEPKNVCAGTVQLGFTLEEIAVSGNAPSKGSSPEKPSVLVAPQSLFDSTRALEGKYTAWADCPVSNGSTFDMTTRIENQIERFAPGFRDRVSARGSVMSPAKLEQHNANLVGGNISGGSRHPGAFLASDSSLLFDAREKSLYLLIVNGGGRQSSRNARLIPGASVL